MLDVPSGRHLLQGKRWRKLPLREGVAGYQLVGGVTAHQGDDGYRV
jgi:hypothetical protein